MSWTQIETDHYINESGGHIKRNSKTQKFEYYDQDNPHITIPLEDLQNNPVNPLGGLSGSGIIDGGTW